MRRIVARSMLVALGLLLACGCSSTGSKSSSIASLNPMKYFAKSKPVAKPSSQMTPSVPLPSADGLASSDAGSGGLAPPSPYGANANGTNLPQDAFAGQYSSSLDSSKSYSPTTDASLAATPQQGMYDPNGYTTTAPRRLHSTQK